MPPIEPGPVVGPLLALDRDHIRLSSPRGDTVRGELTLSNRGDAELDGALVASVGSEWLDVDPTAIRLAPGDSLHVDVHADPAKLSTGYTRGEIEVISNGGAATVAIRMGVRTAHSWRFLALAVAISAAVAAATGLALAGVKFPVAPPAASGSSTATHASTAQRHTHSSLPAFDRRAALAGIAHAIVASNAIWQAAMSRPSAAELGSVKTGTDLARNTAEVEELLSGGDHWQIAQRSYSIQRGSIGVSDDGTRGWGTVAKIERRALFGPGAGQAAFMASDATYVLRYGVVRKNGRWLVDDIRVQSVTPAALDSPTLTVQQVAARILPSVIHVEADLPDGTAVGTGIVIRSSSVASYIITNDHVVSGQSAVRLQRWVNGQGYQPARPWLASKVLEDSVDDLAVLRIAQGHLPVATWGNSQDLQPGQAVVAIGYAENLSGIPTVTDGIVSSVDRPAPDASGAATYIQHSATINHGNSGGPLADMYGHVVGINTWTLDNTQGLFFAIPSVRALRVQASLIGSNG